MCKAESLDEHTGVVLLGETAQASQIVVAKNGLNDDPGLISGDELGIHHDPCDPSVAIVKRVNLRH